MLMNADLHIHSRFSAATSDSMDIETLSRQAPRKGIQLVGTGDCLHGGWLEQIKSCSRIDDGTFERNGTRFILSAEIEDMHRVHHLVYFPSLSAVESFKEHVKGSSKNLETDGRPNVAMGGSELAALAKDVDALIGPAHAFTPWTSMYAAHGSLADCYGDLAPYVSFVELGLSADTDYADTIDELHRLTFLTNSDCHSPHPVRLAREFTRFQVSEPTFGELRKAILRTGGNGPVLNVGLPPQEGKYNESACISCFTHYGLEDAERRRWKCRCGKRIKKGVRDRIAQMANRKTPLHPEHRPPYLHVIPLAEIITKAIGQHTPFSQTVERRWEELIVEMGDEISVLVDGDLGRIRRVTSPAIADAIQLFREHKVVIVPGGGGKYGSIELPSDSTVVVAPVVAGDRQSSLMDFKGGGEGS
jgi:uncharacterized protein (TIGR00375 family)